MGARCRLCADFSEDLVNLIGQSDLLTKIGQLFQLKISEDDQLPTGVCTLCLETVNKIWEYNEKVQRAQELLLEVSVLRLDSAEPLLDNDMVEYEDMLVEEPLKDSAAKRERSTRIKNRRAKKKDTQNDSDCLSGASDAEMNEDGSVCLDPEPEGWASYPWVCCNCQASLPNADDLRDHHATVHGQAVRYSCADCPKVYTKYSTFLSHARTHHPKLKFCCDICGKWFANVKMQERHRASHTDEKPHVCATCGKRFRMQSALLVHARSHLPAELKNRHQCDQCPKRFGTKPNLLAHKRIHAGVREYTCDQCGKSFVQKGNLDNHLLTHTAARPYVCTTCGKAFKTLVRLRKHGSVHSGLKPHQCDVCGRQFRERGTLKEHHRIHTGAMPFTCEFCGKSFRFKGVLTTHRRQHTGERPYSCLECQHHFTNWPNYNKHMKRRHGINTSVTVRKPQTIPPTGMPQRNPPGSVLAPPQQPVIIAAESYGEPPTSFYPVLNLYNLPEELLQQRV